MAPGSAENWCSVNIGRRAVDAAEMGDGHAHLHLFMSPDAKRSQCYSSWESPVPLGVILCCDTVRHWAWTPCPFPDGQRACRDAWWLACRGQWARQEHCCCCCCCAQCPLLSQRERQREVWLSLGGDDRTGSTLETPVQLLFLRNFHFS